MELILAWLEENLAVVTLVIIGLLVLALIVLVANISKLQRLMTRYRQLMRGMTGANLEQLLENSLRELSEMSREQIQLKEKVTELSVQSQSSLQSVGMVRFDAFSDTGGQQSFSLAVADRDGNGFVLTNLHGRDESYFYAKSLVNWRSRYALTKEEEQAIKEAWGKIEQQGKQDENSR